MSRLVAFGCSLTYGHGLPDCFVPPDDAGPEPSKFSWPQILANAMGKECINLSSPGSSNKRIWHNIVNFKFKADDIVFILWSYPIRSAVLNDRHSVQNIGPWLIDSDSATNKFYDLYTDYDIEMQSKLFISHSNLFLKSQDIVVYNLIIDNRFIDFLTLGSIREQHLPLFIYSYCYKYPLALDGKHPGVECNLAFARDILSYLNIKTDIPKQKKLPLMKRCKMMCEWVVWWISARTINR